MLSAVRKALTRCVMEPASPQCGRNWKVFSPRSLSREERCVTASEGEGQTPALAGVNLQDSLAQVVEHHDVGVHVEQVVGVGRVVVCSPVFRLWALVGEHVVAVFGLVVHAVESCDLQT